jgi:hypothetical protein
MADGITTDGPNFTLDAAGMANQSEERLERLQPEARAAFAILCAQRLMDAYLQLPSADQRPFTLSWAPILQEIWTGLREPNNSAAKAAVQGQLKAYYESPFNHNLGEDGPNDADDNTAACSIFAAQAFRQGDAKSARWAAGRLIDSMDERIGASHQYQSTLNEPEHPLIQREVRRFLGALEVLEGQLWGPEMIPTLRAAFEQED